MTPPLSRAKPTQLDEALTNNLIRQLKRMDQYETERERNKRARFLALLTKLFRGFVTQIGIANKMPVALAQKAGGNIHAFGSYRLGVHGRASDIDALCVAPKFVTRDDFFTTFAEQLRARPECSELGSVPDAYVPVIKMVFDGIDVDITFAQLGRAQIPPDLDLADNNLLRFLDERCVRSLNGSRVTDQILHLVPDVETFRTTLRCIKVWAKRRAIYANVMGFFGGVAWAICVARICQLYPNASASTVVRKVFEHLGRWTWPQPVMLCPVANSGPLDVREWNPVQYPHDRQHIMPVITPSYPCMCATHNILPSTRTIMTAELQRAAKIVGTIVDAQSQKSAAETKADLVPVDQVEDGIMDRPTGWEPLFEKHTFFHTYKSFLRVIASSPSADVQLRWAGLVEARLRKFVAKLEATGLFRIVHPFVNGFECDVVCRGPDEVADAKMGDPPVRTQEEQEALAKLIPEQPAITSADGAGAAATAAAIAAASHDVMRIYTASFYIGLAPLHRNAAAAAAAAATAAAAPSQGYGHLSSEPHDLAWAEREFHQLVAQWDGYNAETMGLVVRFLKSRDLPPEVWESGAPVPPPAAAQASSAAAPEAAAPAVSAAAATAPAAALTPVEAKPSALPAAKQALADPPADANPTKRVKV